MVPEAKQMVWTTPGGNMTTTRKVMARFIMPKLHDNRVIERQVHVAKNLGAYDMIIGCDALKDLGNDLKFSDNTIVWDTATIPFRDPDMDLKQLFHIGDSQAVESSVSRMKNNILDAKYKRTS